jgi:NAD(P)-dependent dehydrogenase (short-subunit alcohol dehydrogenase family)
MVLLPHVRRFALSGARSATTARSLKTQGHNSTLFVLMDIGTAAGVQKIVDRVQQDWNGLDILVNCLGSSASFIWRTAFSQLGAAYLSAQCGK